ncbi:ATP-binding protein [Actinospica robiniae]|uniref:ATP-binding protein n=1 Tax=Actinospica robiniae TaxID=304901 RepID=UPI003CCC4279
MGDLITDTFATALFGRRETQRIPVRTSTNQAEAIYLPTAAPGLGDSGVIIGREVYSGKGYVYDPFQLYGQQLPAPHWLVLGESGNGKSALEKTYVLRQLRFRDRQVVVLDAQGEDGVGEWNLIAQALGVRPVRLDPHARGGQGVRLNPLDPAITSTGQLALLRTIVEVALARPLDERSGYALKAAHATIRADALRAAVQPILHDVVDALREPVVSAAEEMNIELDDLREWGLDVALVLDRLVDGDLAGMFDGPTTDGIDLDSPLIVFDLSTIDRNSIAMPILMAIVGVWLEHSWLRPDRRKRIFLVEEAWHIINEPSVAQLFQRLLKFGRRLGLSFVAVVHHLSDVVDGAAAKEASAILKMASTRTIYMQKSDEARATGKVLGLPRWAVEIIPTLSPGIAVWDVNGDVQVVKHIITELEKPLVFTDRAMTESSAEHNEGLGRFEHEEAGADASSPLGPQYAPPLAAAAPAPAIEPLVPSARALPPTRAVPGGGSGPAAVPPRPPVTPVQPTGPLGPVGLPPVPAPARPEPAPLPPTLRQAVAAPKPPTEDPDLTALAAAVFGPRAHTPSHPRTPRRPES